MPHFFKFLTSHTAHVKKDAFLLISIEFSIHIHFLFELASLKLNRVLKPFIGVCPIISRGNANYTVVEYAQNISYSSYQTATCISKAYTHCDRL